MSDIEKVIAKSNHLQALSLKGAALRYPGWGRRAWKTKNGGHGVTLSSGSGEGGREELEISRVNTQRNQKLEKIAHSAERFLITVWNSGDSESRVGHVVVSGGCSGFRSEWMGTKLPLGGCWGRKVTGGGWNSVFANGWTQVQWAVGEQSWGRDSLVGTQPRSLRRHRKDPNPEQPVIRGHTSLLRGTSLTDRSERSREQGDTSISEEYLGIPVFRESLGICGNLSGFLPPP